jgi:hypothetical protein
MAGSVTDVWEKKILDYIFRNTSMALHASNLYICLFTVAPSDSGVGTEVSTSGTAYARQAVDRTGTGWNAATGTSPALTDNAGAISFPTATASYGTVVAFGIANSLAGALSTDLIYWADLTASKAVGNGDTASFAAGALDVTQD